MTTRWPLLCALLLLPGVGLVCHGCAGLDRIAAAAAREQVAGVETTALPGGAQVRVVRYPGRGRPALLLHNMLQDANSWDRLGPLLGAARRPVAVDLLGAGLADRPQPPAGLEEWLAQVDELVQREGAGAPVDLVGQGLGGGLAAVYAARRPQRVAGLVLISPAGAPSDRRHTALDITESVGSARLALSLLSPGELHRRMSADIYTGDPSAFTSARAAQLRERLAITGSAEALYAQGQVLRRMNAGEFGAEIAGLAVPVLIVHGALDALVRVDHEQAWWAAALPAAATVTIPAHAHMPHETAPDAVAAALLAFWR